MSKKDVDTCNAPTLLCLISPIMTGIRMIFEYINKKEDKKEKPSPFGLRVAAILFSYYNFRVSRARTSKSEQIKTSRDLWERINEKYDPIIEIGRSQGGLIMDLGS